MSTDTRPSLTVIGTLTDEPWGGTIALHRFDFCDSGFADGDEVEVTIRKRGRTTGAVIEPDLITPVREALIEALAKAQYDSPWGYQDHTSWEDLHPDTRETLRDVLRNTGWPLIVEFVAAWLIRQDRDLPVNTRAWRIERRWREEMGAPR